eukprot:g19472.t1
MVHYGIDLTSGQRDVYLANYVRRRGGWAALASTQGVKKDEFVVKLEPSDVYDPRAHHEFLTKDVSGKEKRLVMVTCTREEYESLEGSIVNVGEGQLDCLVKTARDTLKKDEK